jgi:hypothetical protein
MNPYLAVGITIGVLAGAWTEFSSAVGLITWIAFVSWACFFAAGAKAAGFAKTAPSTVSGAVYGWLIIWAAGAIGGWPGALAIAVAVGAFFMCVQANWSVLSFIPGAFAGAACLFGAEGDLVATIVPLLVGAALGWLSGWSADRLVVLTTRRERSTRDGSLIAH